ncbi:hypothetical protein, partial [Peribacillus sp. SI8-4]|uniref:hypothetical protein n=1 Tax=Peribacillus sp. SI8-4 TaxID=3048009 RepID=UPI00255319B8
ASLNARGVILHSIEGRGKNARVTVTITNYVWYYLLLREEYRRSDIVEAYLDELFTGNGFMELEGVYLAATLDEFAEKYASRHGGTVGAARSKLDGIRKPLNKYGYVLKGKQSPTKQIRVKEHGQDSYLKGLESVRLSQKLRREFSEFYKEMHQKLPYRKDDSRMTKLNVNRLRKEMTDNFVNSIKQQQNLSLIRSHRMSTLSDKANTDYEAIIELYMSGATFSEIRSFLVERETYWVEFDKAKKESFKNRKSIDEILDELNII